MSCFARPCKVGTHRNRSSGDSGTGPSGSARAARECADPRPAAYRQEVRSLDEFDVPEGTLKDYKISKKELDLAGQLIDGMAADWDPEQYHDEYRDAVMALIEKRIKSGEIEQVETEEEAERTLPKP